MMAFGLPDQIVLSWAKAGTPGCVGVAWSRGMFRRWSPEPQEEQVVGIPRCARECDGGEGGIRTPDTLSGIAVFKTACFNRSHTSPR